MRTQDDTFLNEHHEPSPVRIERRLPTPEEHRRLAISVGWENDFHWPSLSASLDRSLFGVVALDGDEVVGMGRLVGDGEMYFYIQDVAVEPSHQHLGIGQQILDALVDHVREHAPAFVGLFATNVARAWYERNGFTAHDMTGLFRVVQ